MYELTLATRYQKPPRTFRNSSIFFSFAKLNGTGHMSRWRRQLFIAEPSLGRYITSLFKLQFYPFEREKKVELLKTLDV